jgi:four helix bundle protein
MIFMKKVEYSFYRLEVWKLGMNLVKEIYFITKKFPSKEKFCLTSKIRRAAISVPLNITEGSAKRTKKDFASFIHIALVSLIEVMACLEISLEICFIAKNECEKLQKII